MKIAIIGAGNMGGATALGLAGALSDARITVTAKHAATLEKFAARGLQTSLDNVAAAADADVVILGVKPWLALRSGISLQWTRKAPPAKSNMGCP